MFKCIISSNSSHAREYRVSTRSAVKAAQELGRCEGGEVVEIRNQSGRLLSRCQWTPEDGGRYFRSPAWEVDAINTQETREAAWLTRNS